jgi:hypothetical protein
MQGLRNLSVLYGILKLRVPVLVSSSRAFLAQRDRGFDGSREREQLRVCVVNTTGTLAKARFFRSKLWPKRRRVPSQDQPFVSRLDDDIADAAKIVRSSRRLLTNAGISFGPSRRGLCRHSDDFASVTWDGNPFTFGELQAKCVGVLWKAYENGTPWMKQGDIVEKANLSGKQRLRDLFGGSKKFHPAWGPMIVPDGKGRYRLRSVAD